MAEEEVANGHASPEQPENFSLEFSVPFLQQSFQAISQAVEAGNLDKSSELINSFLRFITSVSNAAIFEGADDEAYIKAVVVLSDIQSCISNLSVDKGVINALSFRLPKALAKFAGLSNQCSELVESVLDQFAEKCSSRDIIRIFCEALTCYGATEDALGYLPPLLHGLSKAFLSIERPHFEMVKVAIPAIVKAVKAACFDYETGDTFEKAIDLATSIEALCEKCGESRVKEQLRALLGLFVLQILALVSIYMWNEACCIHLVLQLLHFFQYCGFSYMGLLTGRQVERISASVVEGDSDDYMNEFSYVKHGAVLSVLWGYISDEAAQVAGQDISMLKYKMHSRQIERWEALGMLKYIFSEERLSWDLKGYAIDFLLLITGSVNKPQIDEHETCPVQIPRLSPALEMMMMVMTYAPLASQKKNASTALKLAKTKMLDIRKQGLNDEVLADIPGSFRLDLLQVLVRNSCTSSTTSFLLDCVKDFLGSEYRKEDPDGAVKDEDTSSFLWSANVLQLVEVVLSPPGGQPCLPDQCVAVRSALSLYRFVLVTESAGETNYTGVLSKSNLKKACYEWLLPLQKLVSVILPMSGVLFDELAPTDTIDLNAVEFVLNGNIELVKSKLEQICGVPTQAAMGD